MYERLVLVGPPGGGKGTHAERLGKEMDVPHISTGDMLRREVAEGTDLGEQAKTHMDAGQLVPDQLVTQITVDRLSQADAQKGWILDGFPRNLRQARRLEDLPKDGGVELVFALEVIDEEVFDRISGAEVVPSGTRLPRGQESSEKRRHLRRRWLTARAARRCRRRRDRAPARDLQRRDPADARLLRARGPGSPNRRDGHARRGLPPPHDRSERGMTLGRA